jgi:hypothetical protein
LKRGQQLGITPVACSRIGRLDFGSPSRRAGPLGQTSYNRCRDESRSLEHEQLAAMGGPAGRCRDDRMGRLRRCGRARAGVEKPGSALQRGAPARRFRSGLVQSDTTSLAIEAAPENLREIRSDVEGGVLTVRWEDGGPLHWFRWFSRHPAARVFLSVKAIDKLGLDGSGSVHAATWTHHALELRISGSGDATFDHLTTARLISHIAGSGNIVAAGAAANQEVHISGSGRYRAGDLKSQTATVSISGSGDVQLWVERTLDVRIAGSGDVRYYGAPAVTQSVSGSGSVTGLGAKSAP